MTGAREILRGTLICAGSALALTTGVFFAVLWTNTEGALQQWFAFGFGPPPGRACDAVKIAVDNLRLAAVPYLGVWVTLKAPKLRGVVDLTLAVLLTANCSLVGAAVGAYGLGLLSVLLPHAVLELIGFSVACGAYLAARRSRGDRLSFGPAAAGTGLFLLLAAAAEEGLVFR